jgi:hypothetical protein
MMMTTKLTIVTAALLALFVGNAVARSAHQDGQTSGYGSQSSTEDYYRAQSHDFQMQGR